jgi:hypothetical protein
LLDWRCLLQTSDIEIQKILTENDLGITKSHQAGFLIPRQLMTYGVFPVFTDETLNPRLKLILVDLESNLRYSVNYIKYNNKYFGGTRNEYRITGIARFLRLNLLKPGDSIVFKSLDVQELGISFVRNRKSKLNINDDKWSILK